VKSSSSEELAGRRYRMPYVKIKNKHAYRYPLEKNKTKTQKHKN